MQRPAYLVRVDGHEGGPLAGVPGLGAPQLVEVYGGPDAVAEAVTSGAELE
jgi:hypothetical protein